ncbi:hypothetical protein IWQ60_002604 [Tieghemiomyces parasiticus]|uniref:Uncharacterized protein n=1 Tax=Tieghemiomyces parasiticus TaxID=78921 RepID=A0A9W8AJ92_9FUNG|nr:hypothetical protein IWQ60_002604 [Tieghemiomyces parasiticus]
MDASYEDLGSSEGETFSMPSDMSVASIETDATVADAPEVGPSTPPADLTAHPHETDETPISALPDHSSDSDEESDILGDAVHGADGAAASLRGLVGPGVVPTALSSLSSRAVTPQGNAGRLWKAWSPFFAKAFGLTVGYMLIPFFQGIMLGLGEICANELAFRWGWRQVHLAFPSLRPR